MSAPTTFSERVEHKVLEQLRSQKVGFLLGAGSSLLDGKGYPPASDLWVAVRERIAATDHRSQIQAKLDGGALGLEDALDLLDDGGANDTPHRHAVTEAIAGHFATIAAPLDLHSRFVRRLAGRSEPGIKVFSLNYDVLIERAADEVKVRVSDGFLGFETPYFEPAVFEERVGRIRGAFRSKQFDETARPIHLLKLHGSLAWYECPTNGIRRCGHLGAVPAGTARLMIPPQRRKANDTTRHPYAALWSTFRGCLTHGAAPINRLVCVGYGFCDEHVNAVIDSALARTDFTVLILARELSDLAWRRWSPKQNVVVVTEARCSLKGELGSGHADLWSFARISQET